MKIAPRLLACLSFAALAAPAHAQIFEASYRTSSKTDAILGGAPSALAAVAAAQAGIPAVYARPRPASLVYSRPAVSTDDPDVFNSVALPIGKSPLDSRWHSVAGAGVSGAAAAFAASLRQRPVLARLEAANTYINARVRFVDDRIQFGVSDRWMAASETLGRGRGDCEDYAIAKRAMLRAAGIPDHDLYLVVLKDLARRADHAVLVVRASGRFLVLDNGTDRIVDSSDVADYRPILSFTAGRAFTHGYRRELAPPVTYASNSVAAPVLLAQATFEPASGESDLPDVVRESRSLVPSTVSL